METPEDFQRVGQLRNQFYIQANSDEGQQVKNAIVHRSNELLSQYQRESAQSLKLLTEQGFVLDTTEWLTVKRYAQKYGLTVNVVINWINRGVIPADCVQTLPELNNLRLVKDQPYR